MKNDQKISVPLKVGSRVTMLEDVDIDSDEGVAATVTFSDYVDQYNPDTGLLKFEDSEIGRAEFEQLVEEADGIEILLE